MASGAVGARFARVARLDEVPVGGCLPVVAEGQTIVLFNHGGHIHAVDNRCPHMGFPLHRGTVEDGILTCHWHHARFDLATGGTFDQWADDVRVFPVEVRDGAIWVDVAGHADPRAHHRQRLRDGLERNVSLILGKSVVALVEDGVDPAEPFRLGLEFGVRNRAAGWGAGLTILTCQMNLMPSLAPADRPRALFHGLAAVARDCAGAPPRRELRPLPGARSNLATLGRWLRQFAEVRDAEGVERCIVTAVDSGAPPEMTAGLIFSAITDHRYVDSGHTLDFANKAFEALDHAGWDLAAPVLASLCPSFGDPDRAEESSAWQRPEDLVSLLERASEQLPATLAAGRAAAPPAALDRAQLAAVILGERASSIVEAMLEALRLGCPPVALAGVVAYAAALRVVRFHTSNEFGDWDAAHHAFTYANAVHQAMRRAPSADLLRAVFDAAVATYLNRFLNVPPARLPDPDRRRDPATLLAELPILLDRQAQVDTAATLVADYLAAGGDPAALLATFGSLLLREDRDFHTIQHLEAAYRQFGLLEGTPEAGHVLVAAVRYLAAHAPTMRAQGQTYRIAFRLSRGERLFEEEQA